MSDPKNRTPTSRADLESVRSRSGLDVDPDDIIDDGHGLDPASGQGSSDHSAILMAHGTDARSPLDWLLLAIIDAHPPHRHERERRLHDAKKALIGIAKAGRRFADDEQSLLELGREYARWRLMRHRREENLALTKAEMRGFVRDVFGQRIQSMAVDASTEPNSLVTRLTEKFNADPGLWIARAQAAEDWGRHDNARTVRQIVRTLNELGIPADEAAIDVRKPR